MFVRIFGQQMLVAGGLLITTLRNMVNATKGILLTWSRLIVVVYAPNLQ